MLPPIVMLLAFIYTRISPEAFFSIFRSPAILSKESGLVLDSPNEINDACEDPRSDMSFFRVKFFRKFIDPVPPSIN